VEKLISLLFFVRNLSHLEHLNTTSYGVHRVLDHFYTDVIELADDLIEMYIGKNGPLSEVPIMTNKPAGNIVDVLRTQVEWIEKNRYKFCDKDDAAMQSLLDPIIALFYQTIYKLNRLK
jgi:hypothetical protein